MGQYFKAINTDKHEYICPWCISGGAKLWEWSANPKGSIFTLLLRRSTATGGGDCAHRTQVVNIDDCNIAETIGKALAREGKPMQIPESSVVGRWAGDSVYLIGDYDDSGLYQAAESHYRNISEELVAAWNPYIELDEYQLTYEHCGCGKARLCAV